MTPVPDVSSSYVSAHPRARLAVILIIVGAVISVLTIAAELAEIMLTPFGEDQEIADNPAGFVVLMSLFGLVLLTIAIYIATIIVFLMWLHRACKNLRAFGYWKSQIGYSPGWAVGSFFVPFANLFVPYQAVREIWQKSQPANSEMYSPSASPPRFFPAWWAFWLLSNFASNAYFRMSMSDGVPTEATAIVGIISEILSIAAAVFVIQVIKEIDRRQEETALIVKASMPGPPPPPDFGSTYVSAGQPA